MNKSVLFLFSFICLLMPLVSCSSDHGPGSQDAADQTAEESWSHPDSQADITDDTTPQDLTSSDADAYADLLHPDKNDQDSDLWVEPDSDQDWTQELDTEDPDIIEPTEPSLFAEGCPVPGKATAREIKSSFTVVDGPDAIGTVGDFLIMNEKAAFVIQSPNNNNAYYYYGGIVVDAVPVDGCNQAGPDRFGELGINMGTLAPDLYGSTLRAFRGESAQVLSSGADGSPAVVRVTGVDDRFWLIELELVRQAFFAGKKKTLSTSMNLDITIDYILEPGSSVLKIEVTYNNVGTKKLYLLCGAEAQFGQTSRTHYWSSSTFGMAGFNLEQGVPWIGASEGDGAVVFGLLGGNLGTLGISGVTALVDIKQLEGDAALPAGETKTLTYLLSVGNSDLSSAVSPLCDASPEPMPGISCQNQPLSGFVVEGDGTTGIAGAQLFVEASVDGSKWGTVSILTTEEDGSFQGLVPLLGPDVAQRLRTSAQGRPAPEPTAFPLPDPDNTIITMAPSGSVRLDIRDTLGNNVPAKVILWQNGTAAYRFYAGPQPSVHPTVPGTYSVSVTRGYEWEPTYSEVVVAPDTVTDVALSIEHVVDTGGWMSIDTHAHAAPSPDSFVAVPHRILTAAGEGLDAIVSSDHEFVGSWQWGIDQAGLLQWIATVPGTEATATLPEHVNAFPLEPDFEADARGGFVRWYGMDIDEFYEALWQRGAGVVSLNHPRGGAYMDIIAWDAVNGVPTMTDPTLIAMPPEAALWSWNFTAIELMNGFRYIFRNTAVPGSAGGFDDWMGFHNLGHKITALGSSDVHGEEGAGRVRTYFRSANDLPSQFDQDEMVQSINGGRALISAGAFLRVTVDETAEPGDTLLSDDGLVTLHVTVAAPAAIDVAYVKVYINCDEVPPMLADEPDGLIKLDRTLELQLDQDSHLVVAAFGTKPMPLGLPQYTPVGRPRAITNPIFVDIAPEGWTPPGAKSCSYEVEPSL